jgi:hypothetical protein
MLLLVFHPSIMSLMSMVLMQLLLHCLSKTPFGRQALQLLMPKAHNQVMKLLKVKHSFGDSSYTLRTASSLASLMKWAQHNPVVAAYGVLQGYPY